MTHNVYLYALTNYRHFEEIASKFYNLLPGNNSFIHGFLFSISYQLMLGYQPRFWQLYPIIMNQNVLSLVVNLNIILSYFNQNKNGLFRRK